MQSWVHLAGVYNGKKVKLFVNGIKQRKKTAITGNVHNLGDAKLVLGSQNFQGRLEEVRISNKVRTNFPVTTNPPQQVLRHFYYAGWTCIEERDQVAPQGGSFAAEKVTRQFVDGANIDEHICVDYYTADGNTIERTYFYHANHRGDIIALTDANAAVVVEIRYSAYGRAARVNDQGQLDEFSDFASLVVFGFQSRRHDCESSLLYFRNRYYSSEQGRWLSRDGLGYVDGLNLYEGFGHSPYLYRDFLGQTVSTKHYSDLLAILRSGIQKKSDRQARCEIIHRIRDILAIFWNQSSNKILEDWQMHQWDEFPGGPCGLISSSLFDKLKNKIPIFFLSGTRSSEGHGINAIFIGKNFSLEEMGNICNWVPIEMNRNGIFPAFRNIKQLWADFNIILPSKMDRTSYGDNLVNSSNPLFQAYFQKDATGWIRFSNSIRMGENYYYYDANKNQYYENKRKEIYAAYNSATKQWEEFENKPQAGSYTWEIRTVQNYVNRKGWD